MRERSRFWCFAVSAAAVPLFEEGDTASPGSPMPLWFWSSHFHSPGIGDSPRSSRHWHLTKGGAASPGFGWMLDGKGKAAEQRSWVGSEPDRDPCTRRRVSVSLGFVSVTENRTCSGTQQDIWAECTSMLCTLPIHHLRGSREGFYPNKTTSDHPSALLAPAPLPLFFWHLPHSSQAFSEVETFVCPALFLPHILLRQISAHSWTDISCWNKAAAHMQSLFICTIVSCASTQSQNAHMATGKKEVGKQKQKGEWNIELFLQEGKGSCQYRKWVSTSAV